MAAPRILALDNYDSFTFTLVDYLASAGANVTVVRNDELTVAKAISGAYDGFMISPGPGDPRMPEFLFPSRLPASRRSGRYSASALAIRPSPSPAADKWVGFDLCTARSVPSLMTQADCSRVFRPQ